MNPTNPSNEPNQPQVNEAAVPPLPPPIVPASGLLSAIEALLKRPTELIAALQQAEGRKLSWWLGGFALLALAAYGLVVGTFSGGTQAVAAPLKISLGAGASLLICLPSLFIFTCLSGAEVSFRGLVGVACGVLALTALLLIGFAPVAWVFSQSTDSVAFIGTLHLLFWLIALWFGLRLLDLLMDFLRVRDRFHLKIWMTIFLLVSLQMSTALRPIVGTSEHLLPGEKKFFMTHWMEILWADAESTAAR